MASLARTSQCGSVGTSPKSIDLPFDEGGDAPRVKCYGRAGQGGVSRPACYSTLVARSLSAFAITLTDESAIAAAANTGESRIPKSGYRTPAAMGMPATL